MNVAVKEHRRLLGLLAISPTGDLSLVDLTGSVALDLSHARMIPEDGAWFAPGMIVLVDGIYEEEEMVKGAALGMAQVQCYTSSQVDQG
jgi:DNA polymerase epsilon subunit 2